MPYYSDSLIDEVISQNDIVDVVSEYVTLKKSGRNYIGLCPFHREKTPSFVVSMDKQICKCFGCGKGGNVIQFIMKAENLEFKDALEFLALRANIDLSKYVVSKKFDKSYENRDLKERILNLNKVVANYYHNNLIEKLNDKNNNPVKEYILKRKLDKNTIIKYGLGFANGKIPLYNYLKNNDFTDKEIFESGIIVKNENGKIYDRFFARLMFPIIDIRDNVVAFGGRILNDSKPKYLNSSETIVYHKSNHLYCMNYAKKDKIDYIIIVEGYMDALSLQKSGITSAVASLGTALTIEQARLIKKFTDNVIICYDQDTAGKEATLRGLDILISKGLNVKVLKFDRDDVKDPDEYINKYGKERFINCINNSVSLVLFKIENLEKDYNDNDIDSKKKFFNGIASILSKIENNIERHLYLEEICEKYKISKEPILKEMNKNIVKTVNQSEYDLNAISRKIAFNNDIRKKREQYIIALLLVKDKKMQDELLKYIDENTFKEESVKNVYKYIFDLSKNYDISKIDILSKTTDENIINELTDIMYIDIEGSDRIKLLKDVLKNIRKDNLLFRRNEILDKLKGNISKDEKNILLIEVNEIIKGLNELNKV